MACQDPCYNAKVAFHVYNYITTCIGVSRHFISNLFKFYNGIIILQLLRLQDGHERYVNKCLNYLLIAFWFGSLLSIGL
jgi:hypothetical protein